MNTFPSLPFTLVEGEQLTEDQQQANLEFLAPFILAHQDLFAMDRFHGWNKTDEEGNPINPLEHPCKTTHCIAGFAQIMGGPYALQISAEFAGRDLLGKDAHEHFWDANEDALEYLRAIAGQS